MIYQSINLDINPGGFPAIVRISQYDTLVGVIATILRDGQVMVLPAGTTLQVGPGTTADFSSQTATPTDRAQTVARLEGRGTETAEKIEKRLSQALNEIKLIGEYDYYIVNDNIDEAVALAKCIMAAESARVPDAVKPIIREYENESKQK